MMIQDVNKCQQRTLSLVGILRLMVVFVAIIMLIIPFDAKAQGAVSDTFSTREVIDAGGKFFGTAAEGLAAVVEQAASRYGRPNGYILGQEGSAALVGGARFGDGELVTRNLGRHQIYWTGPSVGFDFGVHGTKVMMLIYNLPNLESMYSRYPGVEGAAFVVGGVSATVLNYDQVVIVPVRVGVGARMGVNAGYIKFTRQRDLNPF